MGRKKSFTGEPSTRRHPPPGRAAQGSQTEGRISGTHRPRHLRGEPKSSRRFRRRTRFGLAVTLGQTAGPEPARSGAGHHHLARVPYLETIHAYLNTIASVPASLRKSGSSARGQQQRAMVWSSLRGRLPDQFKSIGEDQGVASTERCRPPQPIEHVQSNDQNPNGLIRRLPTNRGPIL
jgi:hypothetical protein